jgi:hypothetical protein
MAAEHGFCFAHRFKHTGNQAFQRYMRARFWVIILNGHHRTHNTFVVLALNCSFKVHFRITYNCQKWKFKKAKHGC